MYYIYVHYASDEVIDISRPGSSLSVKSNSALFQAEENNGRKESPNVATVSNQTMKTV